MNEGKRVRITIDQCGNPTIKGVGFVGSECIEKMKPYEDLFSGGGNSVTESHVEDSMIETETQVEEVQL